MFNIANNSPHKLVCVQLEPYNRMLDNFPHYLTNSTIFGKKIPEHKMNVRDPWLLTKNYI